MNILTRYPIHEDDLKKLKQLTETRVIQSSEVTSQEKLEIDVIFGWDDVAKEILNNPQNRVKFIQTYSAGVDYLPQKLILDQDIMVANSSGIHGKYIAQMVLGYLLAFSRGIQPSMVSASQHKWSHLEIREKMFALEDATALVFGTGHIGSSVGELLQQFGVKTVGVNHSGQSKNGFDDAIKVTNYQKLLAKSDIVINTMPLTGETVHFFDNKFFNNMNANGIFINVGRGASVETNDLSTVLKEGRLRGAALDVVESEPLGTNSPLWSLSNVILTPHISGTIPHLRRKLFAILFENLQSLQATGKINRNVIDIHRGY
ncbi:NAD(P)-dependent oxidoreductase [Pediococcus claussenii]|uniref:D-isomer specific 2-hydroxyacid dehydrogenase, NAD binding domain protein n=1 Tax=Pediococcus claussenii (strain ATCC BAA-344 / DSM 14800 / JCM 18046 / KCTC 3811 / LMG 21948 / P06) TaxID=701521 RepID=G8PBH3_PEDCP|nr:NAD(P)-dependent oxidoreductase [Pediococcus claussenii]AEV95962.1 D-isomer specific 2-hydroxyacid dehydrogenase, NAD binding domain protein [Pediococcus claussenii ATCC BAA-344]ANZ69450.1 hypothetical protein AYR57_03615 [Pediococcus claussenii]ANZ71270.1 hypothetical protein AYR58_03630 [Pediococcus claussenii]KRN20568.1 hypothetical protein IV79_GL000627 [Pediococcus claussenii]